MFLNTTVQQKSSVITCFKNVFQIMNKKKTFECTSSINNKTAATTITTTTTSTNNNRIIECVVTDNKTNETEDYGYHSIPRESQLDSQTSLTTSFEEINENDESIELTSQISIQASVELFINKLQSLIEVYIRPLIALNILSKKEYLILFQNMEKLVPVSKYFYNVVVSNDYNSSLKIVFETFETYLCGLPNAIKLLQDLLVCHEEFYRFLKVYI